MENSELRASDTKGPQIRRAAAVSSHNAMQSLIDCSTAALQHCTLQLCSGIYKFIFAQFLRCACLIRSITAAYPPSPATPGQPRHSRRKNGAAVRLYMNE